MNIEVGVIRRKVPILEIHAPVALKLLRAHRRERNNPKNEKGREQYVRPINYLAKFSLMTKFP